MRLGVSPAASTPTGVFNQRFEALFPPWLPVSAPPTGLDECFFFISLVVGLPYSLIFCQFWLFFVFRLLLSFFWLCEEVQFVYLCLHIGWNPALCIFLIHFFVQHSTTAPSKILHSSKKPHSFNSSSQQNSYEPLSQQIKSAG